VAPWRGLSCLLRRRSRGWERQIPESEQSVRIEPSVLRHVRSHRQSGFAAQEAGGQLFGSVTPELVVVSHAVGPHRADERRQFGFRSNPQRAQAAIERFARRGILYLGEWHTHAEAVPRYSGADEQAMRQIYSRSLLNTEALLLVILGLAAADDDIGVWYLDRDGMLRAIATKTQ
jgi:integrative and conjugative element protein (TIGR02256 family)